MERLTKWNENKELLVREEERLLNANGIITKDEMYKIMRHLAEKLAQYEDAEEQGLLLRLPCKVGDIIWDNDFGKPCAYRITGFSFGEADGYIDDPVITDDIVYYYSNYNGSIMGSFAMNEIGKSLFLTQAEAEQKLKEMESD